MVDMVAMETVAKAPCSKLIAKLLILLRAVGGELLGGINGGEGEYPRPPGL